MMMLISFKSILIKTTFSCHRHWNFHIAHLGLVDLPKTPIAEVEAFLVPTDVPRLVSNVNFCLGGNGKSVQAIQRWTESRGGRPTLVTIAQSVSVFLVCLFKYPLLCLSNKVLIQAPFVFRFRKQRGFWDGDPHMRGRK